MGQIFLSVTLIKLGIFFFRNMVFSEIVELKMIIFTQIFTIICNDMLQVCLEHYTMNFLGDILSPDVKRHNFTICELEGKQPKKMAPPPPPPPPNLGKVRLIC